MDFEDGKQNVPAAELNGVLWTTSMIILCGFWKYVRYVTVTGDFCEGK